VCLAMVGGVTPALIAPEIAVNRSDLESKGVYMLQKRSKNIVMVEYPLENIGGDHKSLSPSFEFRNEAL
jgi:predicted  nucleic acid-binding Zn ribbon protein